MANTSAAAPRHQPDAPAKVREDAPRWRVGLVSRACNASVRRSRRLNKIPIHWYCATATALHSVVAILGIYFPGWFGYSPAVYVFSDVKGYYRYARLVSQGQFPYGNFMFEYPPLAIPVFAAPFIVARTFDAYKLAFACEMLTLNAFAVWLVAREIERTEGVERIPGRLAWYTAYFVILCPLIVTRFDVVPMLLAFLAATLFARDRPVSGGLTAGIGALTKLVPGLTILPTLASTSPSQSKAKAAAALLIVVILAILGTYMLVGDQFVATLRYHSERGLEIGSVYSSIYMLLNMVTGLPISGRYDHQSINVYGPGSQLVARSSLVLQCACLLLVAWRARVSPSAQSIRPAATLLLAYIVTGKVLSPQYLIWLIPFVVVSGSGRRVFFGCCILTTAIFPWSFKGLEGLQPWPKCLQIARNLGLIWLFAIMLIALGPWPCPPKLSHARMVALRLTGAIAKTGVGSVLRLPR
jgi:hypothetical protein